jgi:chromosome segregation protein
MGAHSYSVIQQDMVEAVLSDKPEERRFLFDEAAGVTKYKHRKRAALRKLEATDADLVRLKDIAAEVRTRVNSLHRQSNKARRYHELKSQWESLHLRLARTDYLALQERVRTQTARADNLRSDLEAARARVAAAEAQRDALSSLAEEHEEQVEQARLALSQNEQELASLLARK